MGLFQSKTFTLETGETGVVRPAEEEDAAALLAHTRGVLADSPFLVRLPEELDITEEAERAWVAKHRDTPGWLAIVVEVDGQVAGLLDFKAGGAVRVAHRGSLGISVAAPWRGRGVGDALLGALLEWATAHPTLHKVSLAVLADNAPAIALYRKHGFRVEGHRVDEVMLGPGRFTDDFLMYRLV